MYLHLYTFDDYDIDPNEDIMITPTNFTIQRGAATLVDYAPVTSATITIVDWQADLPHVSVAEDDSLAGERTPTEEPNQGRIKFTRTGSTADNLTFTFALRAHTVAETGRGPHSDAVLQIPGHPDVPFAMNPVDSPVGTTFLTAIATFPDGVSEFYVTLLATNDALVETGESVGVYVVPGTEYYAASSESVVVYLDDNDELTPDRLYALSDDIQDHVEQWYDAHENAVMSTFADASTAVSMLEQFNQNVAANVTATVSNALTLLSGLASVSFRGGIPIAGYKVDVEQAKLALSVIDVVQQSRTNGVVNFAQARGALEDARGIDLGDLENEHDRVLQTRSLTVADFNAGNISLADAMSELNQLKLKLDRDFPKSAPTSPGSAVLFGRVLVHFCDTTAYDVYYGSNGWYSTNLLNWVGFDSWDIAEKLKELNYVPE